ncbi:MAG: hypothetical protein ABH837_01415 [bacterium]
MSKSIVTKFCELYRQYHEDPRDNIGNQLISMLDKMTPKQVNRAHKTLKDENIEIGAAKVGGKKSSSPNFSILHKLSLGAAKRWNTRKKSSITH